MYTSVSAARAMTAPPMASWSLVASPEYDPGREVLIDCEEYGLPHLPGWVRKIVVRMVSTHREVG